MRTIKFILLFLINSQSSICQNVFDGNSTFSKDTIQCRITLVNDHSSICFSGIRNQISLVNISEKNVICNFRLRENVKNIDTVKKPEEFMQNWGMGIEFSGQYNYRLSHSSIAFAIRFQKHRLYAGPEYTWLTKPLFGDPVDVWNFECRGIGFGYGYEFYTLNAHFNLFLKMNISVFDVIITQSGRGPYTKLYSIRVVENTIAVGTRYRLSKLFSLFGGLGFGSTNGFFLMVDEFIPNSFFGVQYELNTRPIWVKK